MQMDDAFSFSRLRLTLSTHQPVQQLELDVDSAKNLAHFTISLNAEEIEKGSFTLDQNGMTSLLERTGLPVGILKSLLSKQTSLPAPAVTARQSTLKMGGETISTYVISATLSGQPLVEAHITQLGQILQAKAPALGYKLLPHNAKDAE